MSSNLAHAVWLTTEFSLSMKHQNVPLAFLIHFANHLNLEISPLPEALAI
jgi:hypothetical protein